MKQGKLRKIWSEGGCALNGWLSIPCAFSAEIMAQQGWDSLTVDMQHGLIDYQEMTQMLPSISGGADALARVPWLEEGAIMKALDAGAAGVICPMINTRADAERLAAATRYPPLGKRSFGPIRARLQYGKNYSDIANDEIIVLAMVETAEAVDNVDEILSVPGLDGAYVGPNDLASSLGCEITFNPTAEPVLKAIDKIYESARRHKVRIGIHTGSPEHAGKMRQKGFDLVTVSSDARLIASGAQDIISQFRNKK